MEQRKPYCAAGDRNGGKHSEALEDEVLQVWRGSGGRPRKQRERLVIPASGVPPEISIEAGAPEQVGKPQLPDLQPKPDPQPGGSQEEPGERPDHEPARGHPDDGAPQLASLR